MPVDRSALRFIGFLSVLFIFVAISADRLWAQLTWKEEWEKTLRAGEIEGQLTLYGCCYEYDRILEAFKKKHPKIKVDHCAWAGRAIRLTDFSGA